MLNIVFYHLIQHIVAYCFTLMYLQLNAGFKVLFFKMGWILSYTIKIGTRIDFSLKCLLPPREKLNKSASQDTGPCCDSYESMNREYFHMFINMLHYSINLIFMMN